MGVLKGFDASSVKREKAVVGNDRHNIVRPGLNYMGVCRNTSCQAVGKAVVCHRGAGTFLVNDDVMSQVNVCPLCRKHFELETLVLNQCRATATVLRHNEERAQYEARGSDELLLIAATKSSTGVTALPLQSDALLTMKIDLIKRDGGNCTVM